MADLPSTISWNASCDERHTAHYDVRRAVDPGTHVPVLLDSAFCLAGIREKGVSFADRRKVAERLDGTTAALRKKHRQTSSHQFNVQQVDKQCLS